MFTQEQELQEARVAELRQAQAQEEEDEARAIAEERITSGAAPTPGYATPVFSAPPPAHADNPYRERSHALHTLDTATESTSGDVDTKFIDLIMKPMDNKFNIIGDNSLLHKDDKKRWVLTNSGYHEEDRGLMEVSNLDKAGNNFNVNPNNNEPRTLQNLKSYCVRQHAQNDETEMCKFRTVQTFTGVLYQRQNTPISFDTFNRDIKAFKWFMDVLNVLGGKTLDKWNRTQAAYEHGPAHPTPVRMNGNVITELDRYHNSTKATAAVEEHKAVLAKEAVEAEAARHEASGTYRAPTKARRTVRRSPGPTTSSVEGLATVRKFGGMRGGGSKYEEWMKEVGPNLFLLLNALFNLNVMGTKVGGDLFVVESVEEYKMDWKSRMGVTGEDIDAKHFPNFFLWLGEIIRIVNSNREIFDSGHIQEPDSDRKWGAWKGPAKTSKVAYNLRWTGPGSPWDMWSNRGLQIIKSGFQKFGREVGSPYALVPVPLHHGGGDLKLGNISFESIVKDIKGNSKDSQFIGGMVTRGNNNNYEGELLMAKLTNHWNNIKSALRSNGQKLDRDSDDYMKNLLKEIKISIFYTENILKNIANWIRIHAPGSNTGQKGEMTLAGMMKSYTEQMRKLKGQTTDASSAFFKIENVPNLGMTLMSHP